MRTEPVARGVLMPTESTNNAYNLEVREDDTQGQTNNSAAFTPIITVGAFVFPDVTVGMMDASATRRPSMPWTLRSWSTTHIGLCPIWQGLVGCGQRENTYCLKLLSSSRQGHCPVESGKRVTRSRSLRSSHCSETRRLVRADDLSTGPVAINTSIPIFRRWNAWRNVRRVSCCTNR